MSSSPSQKTLKIDIIGFGPFAQFLAKTIIKQGHSIRATSRSDYTELCIHLGISFFGDIIEFLESDNDVILLCTSIMSLSQVLPSESDVLCTHPMFGPESGRDGWKDLPFMYDKVRIRNEAICHSFLQIFESEGCKMLEMSCEEHDEMAAKSQFLTHMIGRVLSEMEIGSTPIDTKGFQKLVQVKESTARDSFDLFCGLFIHNRFAKQQLRDTELAVETIKQQLFKRMDEELAPEKKNIA